MSFANFNLKLDTTFVKVMFDLYPLDLQLKQHKIDSRAVFVNIIS